MYQSVFKRYEMKYMINYKQKQTILKAIEPYMDIDKYGLTTIRNIYFDTDNFRLIRRSLEKPEYKEKLRIRSYKQVSPENFVFVEIKKKYKSVVYKRRVIIKEHEATDSFLNGKQLPVKSQIGDEIEYFRSFYNPLFPKIFLSYEREAFYSKNGGDFRITFDRNILYRDFDISLCSETYGKKILKEDNCIMEIKTSGGMPLWLNSILTKEKIFKTSFSKYGTAYMDMMEKDCKAGGF